MHLAKTLHIFVYIHPTLTTASKHVMLMHSSTITVLRKSNKTVLIYNDSSN
jgi:hypothetical protein